MPDDTPEGSLYRDADTIALVLFGDGTWRGVAVKGWLRDRNGRWRFLAEWSALNELWTGWYIYDASKVRPLS